MQQVEKGSIVFERFNTKLGIQYSHYASKKLKKDYWVVKKGFIYYLDDTFTSYVYVPRGYLTDGASVPRMFWNIIPAWGEYGQACVLHDYLCEYNYYFDGLNSFTLSRKKVNKIFDDSMRVLNVSNSKRFLIYNGVEFYRRFVNDGFEQKNVKKVLVEDEILSHYKKTGEWL